MNVNLDLRYKEAMENTNDQKSLKELIEHHETWAQDCRGMAGAAYGIGARLDGDSLVKSAEWHESEALKLRGWLVV